MSYISNSKELKSIGLVIRNGQNVALSELSKTEQTRLSAKWNRIAMETAGYTYVPKHGEEPASSDKED